MLVLLSERVKALEGGWRSNGKVDIGVSDLFIETHGRWRPRLNDRLMLDGVLWVLCSGAA